MQQQGQPPMLTPMQAQLPPANNISTEVIQKYLDENKQLILAILDNQNLGKLAECAQYQARLQNNLLYLAAIADAQPQIAAPHPQMPIQQGVQYMQPQPNFSPRGSQRFYPQQFQEQAAHLQMNHSQMLPSQGHMHAISNGACVMRPEGVLGGSSGSGASMPPASSSREFAHGGPAVSFDGQANASVLETASLEGQRSSASQPKTSDIEKN